MTTWNLLVTDRPRGVLTADAAAMWIGLAALADHRGVVEVPTTDTPYGRDILLRALNLGAGIMASGALDALESGGVIVVGRDGILIRAPGKVLAVARTAAARAAN